MHSIASLHKKTTANLFLVFSEVLYEGTGLIAIYTDKKKAQRLASRLRNDPDNNGYTSFYVVPAPPLNRPITGFALADPKFQKEMAKYEEILNNS